MPQECFRLSKAALHATAACNFDLFGIPFGWLLRGMGIARGAPARFDLRDIDVVLGCEHRRVLGDLIVVKTKALAGLQPGIQR